MLIPHVYCRLIVCVPVVAASVLVLVSDAVQGSEKLEKELKLLVQGLRSERMKELANQHGRVLNEKDAASRASRDAVDFFYDLKATRVLAAVLELEESSAKGYLFLEGLEIFGPADLALLHDAAAAHAKRPVATLGSEESQREDIVNRLCLRTARILGQTPRAVKTHSRADIRTWWIESLRAAKEKTSAPSAVESALKHVEADGKKK